MEFLETSGKNSMINRKAKVTSGFDEEIQSCSKTLFWNKIRFVLLLYLCMHITLYLFKFNTEKTNLTMATTRLNVTCMKVLLACTKLD